MSSTTDGAMEYYADDDQDTYGDPDTLLYACISQPGFVQNGDDCDDSDAEVNPTATEVDCDGKDNNCDGIGGPDVDEDGDGLTWAEEASACVQNFVGGQCVATSLCASDCNTDSDGDTIPDWEEWASPSSSLIDTDGDCIPNIMDDDDDGDGLPTAIEGIGDVDGQSGRGGACFSPPLEEGDLTDGDQLYNEDEPNGVDNDEDGAIDENAPGGAGPQRNQVDGVPNYLDDDSDGDGIPDGVEGLVGDLDGDGVSDWIDCDDTDGCEGDADNDGIRNCDETTWGFDPANADSDGDGLPDDFEFGQGTTPQDYDGDGIYDGIDSDDDNDGVPTGVEVADGIDTDSDNDNIPDYLDEDDDGDGQLTIDELCTEELAPGETCPVAFVYSWPTGGEIPNPPDNDCDGTPDYLDTEEEGGPCGDRDNDGILTQDEDTNGNGIVDPGETDPDNDDTDGDGIIDGDDPDPLNIDDDGDGIPTAVEGGFDTDGDGVPNYLDEDSDGDGIPDAAEGTGDNDCDGTPDFLDATYDAEGAFCDTAELPEGDSGSNVTPTDDGSCGCAHADPIRSLAWFGLLFAAGRRRKSS